MSSVRLIIQSIVFLVFAASQCPAFEWSGYQHSVGNFPAAGSFFDPNCWKNYEVPGTAPGSLTNDSVFFGLPNNTGNANFVHHPHIVYFGNFNFYDPPNSPGYFSADHAETRQLSIAADEQQIPWVFDFGSGQNPGASFPEPAKGGLRTIFADVLGSLLVRNGEWEVSSLAISHPLSIPPTNSTATLVVEGAGAAITAGDIKVGDRFPDFGQHSGSGILVVTNGGRVQAGTVGLGAHSTLIVSGTGSTLNSLRDLEDGTVLIDDGGEVSIDPYSFFQAGLFYLGSTNEAPATVTLRGAGSRWLPPIQYLLSIGPIWDPNSGELLSQPGRGAVHIESGGWFPCGRAVVGCDHGTNEIVVSGMESRLMGESLGLLSGSRLEIRDHASAMPGDFEVGGGELLVHSGGKLTTSNAFLVVEQGEQTTHALIEGDDSTWVTTSLSLYNDGLGNAPQIPQRSTLEVRTGGLVHIQPELTNWFLPYIEMSAESVIDISSHTNSNCLGCGWRGGRLHLGYEDTASMPDGRCEIRGELVMHVKKRADNTLTSGLIKADVIDLSHGYGPSVSVEGELAAGDRFKLFEAPIIDIDLARVSTPPLSNSLQWDLSRLKVDGTIGVVSVTIAAQPASQFVVSGGNAQFQVVAAGVQPFTYQWQCQGTNLIGQTNDILTLSRVSEAMVGAYTVVVSNLLGSVQSDQAILSVIQLISFETNFSLQIRGMAGWHYRIEAVEKIHPTNTWVLLTNFVLQSSDRIWSDPESGLRPARFYRFVISP